MRREKSPTRRLYAKRERNRSACDCETKKGTNIQSGMAHLQKKKKKMSKQEKMKADALRAASASCGVFTLLLGLVSQHDAESFLFAKTCESAQVSVGARPPSTRSSSS